MKFIDTPSPNFNARAEGCAIEMLVLHYTDTRTAFDALAILQNPDREVSAHYLVDENGDIYRMVDEDARAWHAGVSSWEGRTDINSRSVGIEIQNPGHSFGYVPFPEAQMQAVAELSRAVIDRHDIPAHYVLAHSDVAPARKSDPGELFDWAWLASQGVGVWPGDGMAEESGDDFFALLEKYGYDISDTNAARTAFRRHFQPETFADNPDHTDDDAEVARRRIAALLRQKLDGRRSA